MKHWRHYIIILVLVVLPFGALVVVNAYDYFQFHRAIARAEGLTQAEFLAIGDFYRTVTQHIRYDASQVPVAIQPLKPLSGFLYPGSSDVLLYERGDVYLYLRVSTSKNNQRIIYFTNSGGPQTTKVLWNRNPTFIEKVSPAGRLVTVNQWTMAGSRNWIVLNDRILVIDGFDTVGSEDTIRASLPLDPEGRDQISEGLRSLDPTVRGKHYRTNVMDGISLHISFTPTGDRGPDDIVISNAWVDAVGPILDLISKYGPNEYPIEYKKLITGDEDLMKFPVSVFAQSEWEARSEPPPKTPWWCVWRSFIRS